jgi:hypothetical protein
MVKEEKKKVKIKLDPEKEVGYTVHSVGPGRKLTLTKSGTTKVKDMKEEQIDELYGKGSLGKIKQYHKDASAVSTDSSDAKSYHDTSIRRSELLGDRSKARGDIAKSKKGSTLEKGWRKFIDAKDKSTSSREYSQASRNSMSDIEVRRHNTYLKARGVRKDTDAERKGNRDAEVRDIGHFKKNPDKYPNATSASSPWVKGVENNRKRAVARAKNIKEETFAGAVVFEVSSHTFHNAKMEKRKGKHWRTYLDECDELSEIRQYANKNPKRPIVLQNRNTNEMVYVRYGKAR